MYTLEEENRVLKEEMRQLKVELSERNHEISRLLMSTNAHNDMMQNRYVRSLISGGKIEL